MNDETENNSASADPGDLYSHTCQLARSTNGNDIAALYRRLSDASFLEQLDSTDAYDGPAVHLRVAGVMQTLAENSTIQAEALLLYLTQSSVYLAERARVELLIQALVKIRPAPAEAVAFWEKHFQPEDGYTPITVWALLNNGSEPAIALFERKMLDVNFPETEREYWLKAEVLQHRNDLSLLQACNRLLESSLEEQYRLLLIDVIFDYQPDDWYGARYRYKPPPREHASKEAIDELRALGYKSLQTQPLIKHQQKMVKQVLRDIDEGNRS